MQCSCDKYSTKCSKLKTTVLDWWAPSQSRDHCKIKYCAVHHLSHSVVPGLSALFSFQTEHSSSPHPPPPRGLWMCRPFPSSPPPRNPQMLWEDLFIIWPSSLLSEVLCPSWRVKRTHGVGNQHVKFTQNGHRATFMQIVFSSMFNHIFSRLFTAMSNLRTSWCPNLVWWNFVILVLPEH